MSLDVVGVVTTGGFGFSNSGNAGARSVARINISISLSLDKADSCASRCSRVRLDAPTKAIDRVGANDNDSDGFDLGVAFFPPFFGPLMIFSQSLQYHSALVSLITASETCGS